MDERTREIIKMALLYMNSNLPDVIECFEEPGKPFAVNGTPTLRPLAKEVEAALHEFQDVL